MAVEPLSLPADGAIGAYSGVALPSPRPGRGRLKVYVGFAPGVGKTYRMLQEAHDLRWGGVDVVLAVVESRGRRETAALARGLERVPPRSLEYRGLIATDVDIDAVVARRPRVVVVDEIAHVNAPGCRNQRRHQDVLQILDSGIDVVCAFDVQQLESLREVVQRATGMSVRETVPDSFLQRADEVVSLDLAPADLVERLRAGKIVSPDQIEPSLAGLFRNEVLSTLRELALREVANSLDRADAESMGGGERQAREVRRGHRLMVCVSSLSPRAGDLLNRGFRLAGRLSTDWALVYVETPAEAPERIGPEAQRQLVETIARARELGASVVRLRATDVVTALLDHAREAGFGHVMVGRSRGRWWERVLGRSRLDRMVREADGLDLHVISFEGDESGR